MGRQQRKGTHIRSHLKTRVSSACAVLKSALQNLTAINGNIWKDGVGDDSREPRLGRVINFNGVDNYGILSNPISLDSEFEINSRVLLDNHDSARMIFGSSVGDQQVGSLANETFFVSLIDNGAGDATTSFTTDGKFHDISLTRNSDDKVDLSIDGSVTRLFSDVAQSGVVMYDLIGNAEGQFWDGLMSRVEVIDKGVVVQTYNFEEESGSTVYSSTTGNTMSIQGALTGFHIVDKLKTYSKANDIGYGYNLASPDVLIPIDPLTGTTAIPCDVVYAGEVFYPVILDNFPCTEFNIIDNSIDLGATGLSIVSYIAEDGVTPYIDGQLLKVDVAGWLAKVELSNGEILIFLGYQTTYAVNSNTPYTITGATVTKGSQNVYDYLGTEGFTEGAKKLPASHLKIPESSFNDSLISRLEPVFPTYTGGTDRTVGSGGDFSDWTSAWTAAVNGDTITFLEDFNFSTDATTYLYINSSKKVLIRGVNDNIVLTFETHPTYSVRLLKPADGLMFKDLIFQFNNITGIRNSGASNVVDGNTYFENCRINNHNASRLYINDIGANASNVYFRGCDFENTIGLYSFRMRGTTDENQIHYFDNCTVRQDANSISIWAEPNVKHALYMYDCEASSSTNNVILLHGSDTTTPTATDLIHDIRDCNFFYENAVSSAVILGRGCDEGKFINNRIFIPPTLSGTATGLALKAINTGSGAIIKGNNITARRPLIVKGAINMDIQYNSLITNIKGDGTALLMNNAAEEIDLNCENIIFKNNLCKGSASAIRCESTTSEPINTSKLTWEFDNNHYYSDEFYIINQSDADYLFSERTDFWNEDENSIFEDFNYLYDVLGSPLTNPAANFNGIIGLNNSEATYTNYEAPALIQADTANKFFDASGNAKILTFVDLLNTEYYRINTLTPNMKIQSVLFDHNLSDSENSKINDCYTKTAIKLQGWAYILDENGEINQDENGEGLTHI